MFEIKGKVNSAICYATLVEDDAIEQIRRMCDCEFTQGAKICIMPDVHAGKGCTIGTTMTVKDKAVPNIVGVDIGCGMYTLKLVEKEFDLEKFDAVVHTVPSGFNVWNSTIEKFDLTELRCYRELKKTTHLKRSLGTLGGGNHFVEVDAAADGTKYLAIHTGSRNLGKQVADYYQSLAVELHKGKEDYFNKRDEIIRTYKEQGRKSEIQAALKQALKEFNEKELSCPADLCYLYGKYFEDYLHDVAICQRFALRNRELIAEIILKGAMLNFSESFHTIHNYIDTDEMILRKGAISARKGEKLLIPVNMRDGCILAYGKGNADWNFSAPHGAGRVLSRTQAKNSLSMEDFKNSMQGI